MRPASFVLSAMAALLPVTALALTEREALSALRDNAITGCIARQTVPLQDGSTGGLLVECTDDRVFLVIASSDGSYSTFRYNVSDKSLTPIGPGGKLGRPVPMPTR